MLAGHTDDQETARSLITDDEPSVRSAAIGALDRLGSLDVTELESALSDPSQAVRCRALEIVAHLPAEGTTRIPGLPDLLADPDPTVVEVACWAAGERLDGADHTVGPLVGIATGHDDPLCREAAVAALGALGHEAGLDAVLGGMEDRPPVRRRAVLALAAFEGPGVETALRRALDDRDRQVRQAAEDLLGDAATAGEADS